PRGGPAPRRLGRPRRGRSEPRRGPRRPCGCDRGAAARRRPRLPVQDLQRRMDGRLWLPHRADGRAQDRRGARPQAGRPASLRTCTSGRDGRRGDRHPPQIQRVPASGHEGGTAGHGGGGSRLGRGTGLARCAGLGPGQSQGSGRQAHVRAAAHGRLRRAGQQGRRGAGEGGGGRGPGGWPPSRHDHPARRSLIPGRRCVMSAGSGAPDGSGVPGGSGSPGGSGTPGGGSSGACRGGCETLAIHAGQEPDPATGAVVPPIYQVSTYAQDAVGNPRAGYEYSRTANPTRTALEECLAVLEGGSRALAFASGMAAEDCLLRTICRPGDHVLIPHDAYGGTYRLFDKVLATWQLSYQPVPMSDPQAVKHALEQRPVRAVWVETPTNPLLSIVDITALAVMCADAGALLVVDNTFASPYLQNPLALGADAVVHSTTKYLGGHSDVVGGALVVADPGLGERLAFQQNATGAVAGPFDAWLTLRGIRTLAVRMDRHSDNALRVADMLAAHPAVSRVFYPGLPGHPGHEIAAKQMRGFGGMVSFRVRGGEAAAIAV